MSFGTSCEYRSLEEGAKAPDQELRSGWLRTPLFWVTATRESPLLGSTSGGAVPFFS